MGKVAILKKIHLLTHLEGEEQKIMLGMLALHQLQNKKITLEEIDELLNSTREGLEKKKHTRR